MKEKRPKKGHHAPGVRFIMLPRALLVHDDWISLPAAARVIFLDMCMRHYHRDKKRPTNNGYIGYGCAAGAKAADISVATAFRMLKSSCENGLIKLRKKGVFKEKGGGGLASEWEISIFPTRTGTAAWRAPADGTLHIETWILISDAYRKLNNTQRCILVELLRRFDGGNNGLIAFGGDQGAWAGFRADTTLRALSGLERAGFIVKTAPAVPSEKQPRRWRLTMHKANGKPATKDFMRAPKADLEEIPDRFTSACEVPENVSLMRASSASNLPPEPGADPPKLRQDDEFREETPLWDARTNETIDAEITRTDEIHLETIPPDRLTSARALTRRFDFASPGLFTDLPTAPTAQERLRAALQDIVRRQRGMQSRLADALGITRQTLSNTLAGRERFTPTAEAALRWWIAGEPISGAWPPLPLADGETV